MAEEELPEGGDALDLAGIYGLFSTAREVEVLLVNKGALLRGGKSCSGTEDLLSCSNWIHLFLHHDCQLQQRTLDQP